MRKTKEELEDEARIKTRLQYGMYYRYVGRLNEDWSNGAVYQVVQEAEGSVEIQADEGTAYIIKGNSLFEKWRPLVGDWIEIRGCTADFTKGRVVEIKQDEFRILWMKQIDGSEGKMGSCGYDHPDIIPVTRKKPHSWEGITGKKDKNYKKTTDIAAPQPVRRVCYYCGTTAHLYFNEESIICGDCRRRREEHKKNTREPSERMQRAAQARLAEVKRDVKTDIDFAGKSLGEAIAICMEKTQCLPPPETVLEKMMTPTDYKMYYERCLKEREATYKKELREGQLECLIEEESKLDVICPSLTYMNLVRGYFPGKELVLR